MLINEQGIFDNVTANEAFIKKVEIKKQKKICIVSYLQAVEHNDNINCKKSQPKSTPLKLFIL